MSVERTLRIAAIQLNSQADLAANLAECQRLVARAAVLGAKAVLLPENFAYMGPETGKREFAETLGDFEAPIQSAASKMARDNQLTLVAGGFPEASGDRLRPYNTCAVFAPNGELAGSYRKIHLFDVALSDGTQYCESQAVRPGLEPVVVEIGGFRVGLSVCYDLRFPELYRALIDRGAEVLLVPAAFTLLTGKDHWRVLLRARAIEAQSFVVAAGQWGRHPEGRSTYGHSLIVDPWGAVVAECSDRVGLVLSDLDDTYLDEIRTRLPSLKHRRM